MTGENESLGTMGLRKECVWEVEAGEAALREVFLKRGEVRESK